MPTVLCFLNAPSFKFASLNRNETRFRCQYFVADQPYTKQVAHWRRVPKADAFGVNDAVLLVFVFAFGRCPEIGSLTFFPEIHLRFGSESAKLQGEIPVEVLAREHFDPVHFMSRFFKTLEKLGKFSCRGNMPSGRAKFIKGILAVKVAALLEGGVFLIVEKAAIFHVVTEVFCKPELITDTDEVVYFVVSVVNEF